MPRKRDDAGKCVDAALSLAASQGWQATTFLQIAEAAGLSVAEAIAAVGSRNGALRALAARADSAMLQAIDEDWTDETIRDRLFTLAMSRFDYLKPHRDGLRAILSAAPSDPFASLALAADTGLGSMRTMLEAAGISTAGIRGRMRIRAMAIAYSLVVRVFLDDDTDDLSKTMAALDRRLSGLERLASRFNGGFKYRARSEEPSEPADP